jgi:hypothetical protein
MAARNERSDRIRQDITDISDADQLLRFATAGQLAKLQELRGDLTLGRIAQGAGLGATPRSAGPVLATALRRGPTLAQLRGLDEIIGALVPDLDGTGSLSSLALRLSPEQRDKIKRNNLAAHVPSGWARKILADPPADEVGVLMQASALLSEFVAAERMKTPEIIGSIRDRYKKEMEFLVRRLILVSVAPPTSRNYDAQIMLGMLASYAFEPMRDLLESQLRYSPMSFRVWRAITKLVRLREDDQQNRALQGWVRGLLGDAEELRTRSLYAGRSLDLELAITVPAAWSPPGDDWAGQALRVRALDSEATIRERGTAAMGLWQRALAEGGPHLAQAEKDLRELIAEFRKDGARLDAPAGMRWLAATLEHVIDRQVAVCNTWPDVDEPWFRHVHAAAGELGNYGIPDHLVTGMKNLFLHMILQNAGVHRREAIETIVTSGWNEPVARALGFLLKTERTEAWLRVRAEFALGFLQRHDPQVEAALTRSVEHAYQNLKLGEIADDAHPPRSHVTEMHASLFAVGDCFGVAGAEARARSARDRLRPILEDLAGMTGDPRATILRRPARAAAYLLTVTAQPRAGGKKDLSEELLEKLSRHPDPVTARLSRWALSFRFDSEGHKIRPFLAAAEYAEHDDTPY